MVRKDLQTLNLKFDQVMFNSLVLTWERHFEVMFSIFSVLVFQITGIWSPQGSVLGPILFLLFINDINKSLDHIIVKLFADDTNCFISGNNFNRLERLVEVELNKLQKWINAN